jgi:hypothetical protein
MWRLRPPFVLVAPYLFDLITLPIGSHSGQWNVFAIDARNVLRDMKQSTDTDVIRQSTSFTTTDAQEKSKHCRHSSRKHTEEDVQHGCFHSRFDFRSSIKEYQESWATVNEL